MIKNIAIIILLIFLSTNISAQNSEFNFYEEIKIEVTNSSNIERVDELVSINVDKLKTVKNNFNKEAFIIYQNGNEIPSQLYNDEFTCNLIFVCNFKPNETKAFSIKYLESGKLRRDYMNRTYAELAMKFDAIYKDNKFNGDRFQNFTKVVVPKIHTDHDALFKYEGPGWESEKVGYRFYLDWRNATDIFGKKNNELILHKVGNNDVIAKDDSYHNMQEWGMDIFKVGNSLGIGSIGMMSNNKIEMLHKTDEVICEITQNGPILSEVKTNYKGWLVGENKFDVVSKFSISAGSRITKSNLLVYENAENITTGLAKHTNAEFIKSNQNGDWNYIALYGNQTLNNDNVGIVLFYKNSDLLKQGEDELNYFVSLKPNNQKVEYAFAATWELEQNGIKNKLEFEKYINDELTKLNNPLKVEIK
ncbi:MAG: DUF4861 domain-containing protein [Ignavibacteriae bacterium]|nr:DUF4861 domain-containing protein [Ignavibacteriota bacterium]